MAIICPAVLAANPRAYREQMARIEPFAERIQIDLTDGVFAQPSTVGLAQVYWPEKLQADLHLMYRDPFAQLETIISLKPNLAIIHAEAEGDLLGLLLRLHQVGIKVGVALLNETVPETQSALVAAADHVLLFSGNLGHFGGQADLRVLRKVADIKAINPTAELGWDGGVTAENAPLLVEGGIDVLDVGGYIQQADDPGKAFQELRKLAA